MSARSRFVALVVLIALIALPAHAEAPAVRTEIPAAPAATLRTSLVALFGDDDALSAPAETTPPSPAFGLGDRPGYASLAEGRASRYTGRENRSELSVDGAAPGFARGWSTRARLALGLDFSALGPRAAPLLIEDVGSFVEVAWTWRNLRPQRPDALTLRLFPLNGDRERVGGLETLAWGGATGPHWDSPYTAARGAVRAARAELGLGLARFHVGLKTATFNEPSRAGPSVEETSYGGFAGFESRWAAPVGVAFSVGHFEHGRLPGGPGASRATTTGASLRLNAGLGFARPRPFPWFELAASPFDTFARGESANGLAFELEAAHLVQRLWDFDQPGVAVLAPARALAAIAELREGRFGAHALVTWRDPAFVMRQGPGAFPGQTLPRAAARRDELGVFVAAEVRLGVLRPNLAAMLLWPAAVMTGAVDALGQPTGATLVLRAPADVEALPPGEPPAPVLEARPGVALELSRLLSAFAWLAYRRDYNRTRLVAAPGGALARGFQRPDRLGYGFAARAVW